MSYNIELKESLLGNDKQLTTISDKVFSKIENVQGLLETLTDYKSRIGTPEDSKSFRRNMKEKLATTMFALKDVTDTINRMDNIEVSDNNTDFKKKQIKRLREASNKQLKEATDLMKSIEKLERNFVQNARKSSVHMKGGETPGYDSENPRQQANKQMMMMDADEEVIREREQDIIELTKLLTEMNAMAKLQAKYIQEQGEELEIAADHVVKAKDNTKAAHKELVQANSYKEKTMEGDKKMLYCIACVAFIFIIMFMASGSPDESTA